jgi:hypothetical protein
VILGYMKMPCRLLQFLGGLQGPAGPRRRPLSEVLTVFWMRHWAEISETGTRSTFLYSVFFAFIRAGKQVSRFHGLFFTSSSPRFPMLWINACAVDRGAAHASGFVLPWSRVAPLVFGEIS